MDFTIEERKHPNIKNYKTADYRLADKFAKEMKKELKEFLKSAILFGSSARREKPLYERDIDLLIIVDDLTLVLSPEVVEAYRVITERTASKISKRLHITTMKLTNFWEYVRNGDPLAVNMLRDGVPFFDRGIFMPWKQLLKMGKIKPSQEAIDLYMSSGEQVLDRVKFKLRDIGSDDFFWATVTPGQAALMLYGIPPPSPKETPELMREIFVKKEKLLEEKDIKTIENVLAVRKAIEHGEKKTITGKEIDELVESCTKYLKRLRKLFSQIEKIKEGETLTSIIDTITTITRDLLKIEGEEKIKDEELAKTFKAELIETGKIPAKYLRTLQEVMKAKKEFKAGKLNKTEIDKIRKNAGEYIKLAVEYMQRKRAKDLERAKIKVKHGDKYGEITILGKSAFVIQDMTAEEKKIQKAEIQRDGSLGTLKKSNFEEMEKALAKIDIPKKPYIAQKFFESLKGIFGKDAEILIA